MDWDLQHVAREPQVQTPGKGIYPIHVLDVFSQSLFSLYTIRLTDFTSMYDNVLDFGTSSPYLGCHFVRQGLIPTVPIKPIVAVTVHTLELYHLAYFHCPHLSISAFVKSLADLHGIGPFVAMYF